MSNVNSSNTNLDLLEIDSADADELANKIETFYKADSAIKMQLSRAWERNHLMLDGKQWIVYDSDKDTGGIWKQLRVSKANEYIPRPTTNYLFDVYQTLKSYLLKNKPRSSITPNTQTYRDKSAAKIGNLILECNWERLKEAPNYEYAAACAITYGTVFKKSYWDTSSLMMAKVPRMIQQPKFDPMSMQQVGIEEVQAKDPDGNPLFDELPLGDVNSRVVEPFRIALDPLATDLHQARWIMEYSIQPLDYIKQVFSKQEPGYTNLVEDVEEEVELSGSMRRFYQLKSSSGSKVGSMGSVDGMTASDSMIENAAVLKEYYEGPTFKYPKGRLICVANNVTLYAGDSPYSGDEQGDWHPYSEFRWEILPGRFWGKGPIDDCIEPQKQINSIDSVIILTRKTQAIPQKLIPSGCGIAPGTWTGRPGQEVPYRDTGGAKPEVVPASGVHETVFAERSQRVEDIKTVSGAIDILKGDRPPGVTAASALNLLYEVGTGKLFPVLDRWKSFVESDQKKQLKIVSKRYKEPRPDFIRILKMKNTELSEEAIDHFIGSDLYDNCNVVVEAGSNIPKLQAAKQAMLQEAAQSGTLALEIPANRLEYNRQMGIAGFDNDVGPDTKRAEWENDLMDDIKDHPDNKPVILEVDEDQIHMEVHARRMKEPSFLSLPIECQQAYMQHHMEHDQQNQKKQQMQMMQAMASGMPPQPGPQPPNAPMPVRGHGEGTTPALKNALHQDALQPGSLGKG